MLGSALLTGVVLNTGAQACWFEDIEHFEDVHACLDELEGRYPVGLLPSGNSSPDRCGLDGRFGFTVFAHDHGAAKPESRLFRIAAEAVVARSTSSCMAATGEPTSRGPRQPVAVAC